MILRDVFIILLFTAVVAVILFYVLKKSIQTNIEGLDLDMPEVQIISNLETHPSRATPGASGYDLRIARFITVFGTEGERQIGNNLNYNLRPGERVLVSTGLKMKIPENYELQIRPRSGLALKSGITVLNSPGTIDSDYLGDIGIIIINHGSQTFPLVINEKIAQGVFAKVEFPDFKKVSEFNATTRGTGGFGSTGRN